MNQKKHGAGRDLQRPSSLFLGQNCSWQLPVSCALENPPCLHNWHGLRVSFQARSLPASPLLDGDPRLLAVPVACEPFSSNSSQFFLSTHSTQPQRAPLITV